MWCIVSSLAFAFVAYLTSGTWIAGASLALAVSSFIYHSFLYCDYESKRLVVLVDRLLIVGTGLRCVADAIPLTMTPLLFSGWVALVYIVYIYFGGRSHCPRYGHQWHSTIHIAGAYCIMVMYYERYQFE